MPSGDDSALHPSPAAIAVPVERVAYLPQGGVFAPFLMAPGGIRAGASLTQSLLTLRPPPLAVVGIVQRLLDDLDVLHQEGGAHGALDLAGLGLGLDGTLFVWPVFAPAPPTPPTALDDVRALGQILLGLVAAATLEAAGVTRAKAWLSGVGAAGARVGFPDARAARQALAVAVKGLPTIEARTSFLAAVGGKLPVSPRRFGVRPVGAVVAMKPEPRTQEARAWIEQASAAAREARHARESTSAAETDRITAELRRHTDAVIEAAGALSQAEAARLRQASFGPAMLYVPGGHVPGVPLHQGAKAAVAGEEFEGQIEVPGVEDVSDEGTFSSSGGLVLGLAGGEATIVVESVRPSLDDSRRDEDDFDAVGSPGVQPAARITVATGRVEAGEVERRIEAERAAAEAELARVEAERVEAARAASEAELARVEAERVEVERRVEAERAASEAELARVEAERAEVERRVEAERAAAEAELARVEAERAEAARAVAAEAELARVEAERAEVERRVEAERAAAEAARVEAERAEAARAVAAEAELARVEAERAEAEGAAAEAARVEAERAEVERRVEAERAAAEAARVASERAEAARAASQAELARVEAERAEAARAASEAELARVEAERAEAERAAAEAARVEAERAEAERAASEAELAQVEAERAEVERRVEAERAAAAELAAAGERARLADLATKDVNNADKLANLASACGVSSPADVPSPGGLRVNVTHLAPATLPRQTAQPTSIPTPSTAIGEDDELSDERERPSVARWEGAIGVTGDESRIHEKGPGKWTLQGRSREELADQLPPGESRPMDLDLSPRTTGSPPWGWVVAGGLILLAAAWVAFGGR